MGVIPFQKPNKVVMHKATDFHGLFEFSPLEKGYGVTIGNAMRRILLSSLEGYAITSVKIQGVDHEFSTIKGVTEDVVEMVLNLKQVRFKSNSSTEEQEKIFISVKGKDQFLAGDIGRYTNAFNILNPELVICNMEPTVNMELEITVGKGRGYVPAEENKVKEEEKEENKEEKEEQFTRKEYNYSSFSRSFTLPEEVNKEKIEAKYEDGVLKLMLPKREEAKRLAAGKHIAVK